MSKLLTITLVSIILTCISKQLSASHILGGEAYYRFIDHNEDKTTATYEITFKIYRDQDGIELESTADFGIYVLDNKGKWLPYEIVENVSISTTNLTTESEEQCRIQAIGTNKLEIGVYTFQTNLPIINQDYKIAFQRCCRNHHINNIKDPGLTGAIFDVEISTQAQQLGINSPRFRELPLPYICTNKDINYEHDAIYDEAYEIRYEFYTPSVAGGAQNYYPKCCDCQTPDLKYCPPPFKPVNYTDGFSFEKPLGESTTIEIDPSTGLISGIPEQTGLYVIGIKATQYLNGKSVSSTKRDFQLDVVACIEKVNAKLRSNNDSDQSSHSPEVSICEYTLCNYETLEIINESTDIKYIEDYSWTIWNTHGEPILNRLKSDEADLIVTGLYPGEYTGQMIVNKGQVCSDTAQFKIRVLPELLVDFNYNYNICDISEVNFSSEFDADQIYIEEWIWEFENGDVIIGESGSYLFEFPGTHNVKLTIIDSNNCKYSIEKIVEYYPNQNVSNIEEIESTIYLCENESTEFNSLLLDEEGTYEYTHAIDENICDSVHHKLHLISLPLPILESHQKFICPNQILNFNGTSIDKPGLYYQHISYIDKSCDSIIRELKVDKAILPEVSIPESTNIIASTDYLLPLNIVGEYSSIKWSPAELLDCDDCDNPSTRLNEAQIFELAIQTIDGCDLQYSLHVEVENKIDFYLPNVLSNKEGKNTLFLQAKKEITHSYSMYVYDRYGNLIHKNDNAICNNESDGWKPDNINTGVYIYYIEFEESSSLNALAGSVTILR